MTIIDTHCHLYLSDFENDIELVVERARNAGVVRFYMPAIDSEVIEDMLKLEAKYPSVFIPMMGLHPCSVKENFLGELEIVGKYLSQRKFAAIGEIGLDFYWDTTFKKEQFETFEKQMEWALEFGLPIVIHTRNAMPETIETVKPFAKRGLKGIFHCFGDNYETAKQIIDMGFLLGIGGVVTYKKSGLDETLKSISLEHIVLETDSPYLTPVPFRGKRNESSYLQYVVKKLAEIKGVSEERVAEITTENAEKVFGK
jgi:TatD DNase family protein